LLLIDAGTEFGYYTSDITRTFPVGRKFSSGQAKAYDLVLKAQKEAVAMTKPGVTLPAIHKHVCEVLVDGMLSLGLLKGTAADLIKNNAHRRFYPHNTSHWLGMDVHDVGDYKVDSEWRLLEPGMTLTVEPGLYFAASKHLARELHNIGIRIEDDVLITRDGNAVLTSAAPKTAAEIEAVMSSAHG
jgi:Xaa-Pro aminopeptidase